MKVCPNINTTEWKQLEKSVGKQEAYRLFISNDYQTPESNPIQSIEQEFNLRNDDGSLKKYVDNTKNFEINRKKVIEINKSGKIPQGYMASYVPATPEKGDKRTYRAIAIIPRGNASNSENKSSQVQEVFGNDKVIKTSTALERILNGKYKAIRPLARRLIENLSNNVEIEMLSPEEMSMFHRQPVGNLNIDTGSSYFTPAGIFYYHKNKIYISSEADLGTLIHEILHAFTVGQLKMGNESGNDLRDIFYHIQEKHGAKGINYTYPMSNVDEFLVAIFTNPEFIKELKGLESMHSKDLTLWDDVLDFLARVLATIGFSYSKSRTLYEESMDAAIRVIEDAKVEFDYNESVNSLSLEEQELLFASPTQEFVESLHTEKKKESKIVTDIKERLKKVEDVLGRKVKNEQTKSAIDKLGKLKDRIKTLDEVEAIQQYIVSAAEIIPEYAKIMDMIKSQPNNTDNIDLLVFVEKFVSTFNNLSSIQMEIMKSTNIESEEKALEEWLIKRHIAENEGRLGEFMDSDYGKNKPVSTTKLLDESVKQLNRIHQDYIEHGTNLQAQVLFSELSEEEIETRKTLKTKLLSKNSKDAYGLSIATTWEELAEQMKAASRDISGFERWLTSAFGGSTNDVISLVAKRIENTQTENIERLRVFEERLGKAHEKYANESGLSKNDVEKFNELFIEIVSDGIDSKGNEIRVKEFISKFDMNRFKTNKAAFYHDNKDLKEKNPKEFKQREREWYRANTVAKSNVADIIASRKAEMSEYEFQQWSKKNIFDLDAGKFRGELTEPAPAYASEKYRELQKNKPAFEYYTVLKETMEELKLLLPTKVAGKLGNRIPSVYKADWERIFNEKKLGSVIKDKVKVNEGDTQYGLLDLADNPVKEIPTHFTAQMPAEITSSDLMESLLKSAKSWITYDSKAKIASEIQLIEDIFKYDPDGFKVNQTTTKGENRLNPTSLVNNVLNKQGETNIQNRLMEVIDDLFYGQEEEKTMVSTPLGEVSADKLTGVALKTTSVIQLSVSWISGSVNALMGNLNNLVEAHSGEFVKKRNLAKGLKLYGKNIHHFLADRGKTHDKHWFTRMVEDFDLLHGEYINSFGDNVSGNRLKREAEVSNLLFLQTGAEHEINISLGLAFMDSVKWINGTWVDRASYSKNKDADMKFFDSQKSLLDSMVEGEGKLVGEQKIAWTKKNRETLKHRTHEVQKYVQGNYASEDKTGWQRRWHGKLAIMFRKYVVPGFARRFGKERINNATGTIMQGYYSSTFGFFKDVLTEMKEVGFREALNRNKPTELQKANMRRVFAEGVALFVILAIVSALTPDDDEEKNTYWENIGLLVARRMQSEMLFYVNPSETWRILKTPAVSMNTVDSATKFAGGLLFKWGEDEDYQRDTGIWKKGDSKDLARFVKLLPVAKGVLTGLAPDEQLKMFNR